MEQQNAMRRRGLREVPLCEATRVDRSLREGERIACKEFELEVLHAPGLTAGHLLLCEPVSRSLLTGDHLMGDAVPFTETYHLDELPDPRDPLRRRPRFRGLVEYSGSLRRLQALFGRADPVTQMRTRMLMVIGGLDVLEQQGRVEPQRRKDGVLVYAPGANLV